MIIIIIVGEGELNTRECVTAIEDQYNFCIKRADLRAKVHAGKIVGTAQMVRRMRRSQLKCAQTAAHRPPQVQNWSGFHVSQTSRRLVQVGLGCREEEGLKGELYS